MLVKGDEVVKLGTVINNSVLFFDSWEANISLQRYNGIPP